MHDAMEDLAEEPTARDPITLLDEQAVIPATAAAADLVVTMSAACDRLRTGLMSVRGAAAGASHSKSAAAAVPHAAVTPAIWLPLTVPACEAAPSIAIKEANITTSVVAPVVLSSAAPPGPSALAQAPEPQPQPQSGPELEPEPSQHQPRPLPPKWSIALANHLDARDQSASLPVDAATDPGPNTLDWRPLAVPPAPPPRRMAPVPPPDTPVVVEASTAASPAPVLPQQSYDRNEPPSFEAPSATAAGDAAQANASRAEPEVPAMEQMHAAPASATPFALRPSEIHLDTAPGGDASVLNVAAAADAAADSGIRVSPPAAAEPVTPEPRPSRFSALVRKTLVFAGYGFAIWLGTMVLLIILFRFVDPPSSMLMVLQRLSGTETERQWVPLSRMSSQLRTAVIVSEDARFCTHWGIDPQEIAAAIARARDGVPRGASTITMQVAKNLFLWPSKSYLRKALEVPLTLAIELLWPKSRILEVYLNVAEWGPGIFGAEAAARHHFGKPAAKLSTREAALLAVALPSPATRDAGDPGIGTARLARAIEARMRASPRAANCVAPPP